MTQWQDRAGRVTAAEACALTLESRSTIRKRLKPEHLAKAWERLTALGWS